MKSSLAICLTAFLFPLGAGAEENAAPQRKVEAVSAELRQEFGLKDHYQKCVVADGFPIVSSEKVEDVALLEAAWLIDHMLVGRDPLRAAMVQNKVRFSIMARDEFTTDVPEHSDLRPAKYWDRRARGLGASPERPSVSCGEENLLCLPSDPYNTENILIHEFAHAIHEMGLRTTDAKFDQRLAQTYEAAMKAGLWKGKYAASNRMEYWAEAVQSWFETNRENDHDHNHVNTRAELKEYDPAIAKLVEEIFGDTPWIYQRPEARAKKDHFADFDAASAKPFQWPAAIKDWNERTLADPETKFQDIKEIALSPAPPKGESFPSSAKSDESVAMVIANATDKDIEIAWIDFDGQMVPHGAVRPGFVAIQDTFSGHVWAAFDADGNRLGYGTAANKDGRMLVR